MNLHGRSSILFQASIVINILQVLSFSTNRFFTALGRASSSIEGRNLHHISEISLNNHFQLIAPTQNYNKNTGDFRLFNTARMPRGVKKENLPSKVCVTCGRPFTWRKKWESCWDEVSTCSKSCNRKRKEKNSSDKFLSRRTELSMQSVGYEQCQEVNVEHEGPYNTERSLDLDFCENNNFCDDRRQGGDGFEGIMMELNLAPRVTMYDDEEVTQDNSSILTPICSSDADENASPNDMDPNDIEDPVARKKALRKAEKKRKKLERREQRQGRGDKSAGQKECDMCGKSVDMLIRCTYDESQQWKMICGKCWNVASGGVVDGDAAHPHYRYGGLWKNRRRK